MIFSVAEIHEPVVQVEISVPEPVTYEEMLAECDRLQRKIDVLKGDMAAQAPNYGG